MFGVCPAFLRELLHDDGGQDVVEYALLTALFCLVALTAWSTIRDALRASYSGTTSGMASGSLWTTVPRLRLFDPAAEEHDALGTSVAAGALGALVGAPYYDGNDVFDQGAVLFYRGDIAAREHKILLDCALKRDAETAKATLEQHVKGGVEHALATGTIR